MSHKTSIAMMLALVGVLCVALAWAGQPGLTKGVTTSKRLKTADEGPNLLAMHDSESPQYNGDCLSCHAGVLEESTRDPRVLSFHQAMMPYTPGYNPAHGPNNEVCVQCHRFVDLEMDSAGALRKQVDPALCALCHGPSGPGPQFYQR